MQVEGNSFENIYNEIKNIVNNSASNIFTEKATAYDNPFKNNEYIGNEIDRIDKCIEDQYTDNEEELAFFKEYREKVTDCKLKVIKDNITTGVIDDRRTHRAMDFLNIGLVERLNYAIKEEWHCIKDPDGTDFSRALSTIKAEEALNLVNMFLMWKLNYFT
jgi:hypothetical protein